MKYFCSKCGKTTQYGFEMPKFCAFCGQSFANKPASVETDDKRNKFLKELKLKKNINQYIDDDDTDRSIGEDPNIDYKSIKAKFKLDIYSPKGESFGNLIDSPMQPSERPSKNNINIQKTSEQILEDFKKESSSSRNKE
jgi:hypothetical protein